GSVVAGRRYLCTCRGVRLWPVVAVSDHSFSRAVHCHCGHPGLVHVVRDERKGRRECVGPFNERNALLKAVAGSSSLPPISARGVFAVILSAVLLVGAYTAGSYFVALAMHIEINPVDWIAINAIASFVQIFPITAGGLGVREGTFAIILGLYGVSFDRAVAFSLTGFTLGAMLTSLLWVALASVGAEPSSR